MGCRFEPYLWSHFLLMGGLRVLPMCRDGVIFGVTDFQTQRFFCELFQFDR